MLVSCARLRPGFISTRCTRRRIASDQERIQEKANENVRMILNTSVKLKPTEKLLILTQGNSNLVNTLKKAYIDSDITIKPLVRVFDFEEDSIDEIKEEISFLRRNDLLVTVQDEEHTFKLGTYRLRATLFDKGVKNIDHKYLSDVTPANHENYIDSLAFNPEQEKPLAKKIQETLTTAKRVEVVSGDGDVLVYDGPMEAPLLNIGDYEGMDNIGGTFPVGEVISESKDLLTVSGKLTIFSFADKNKQLCIPPQPFSITLTKGVVTDCDERTPKEFHELLEEIREAEDEAWIREFGVGLNSALTPTRIIENITAYERLHVSMGKKHNVFKGRSKSRHHADLFVDLKSITIDGTQAFKNDQFCLEL